eukprot:1948932-Rhodomonas_salina.4
MADMIYFVGIVVVLLCAFTGGFYALHGKLTPDGLYGENKTLEQEDFLEDEGQRPPHLPGRPTGTGPASLSESLALFLWPCACSASLSSVST